MAFDPEKRRLWLAGSHCRGRGNMAGVAPEILREPFAPKQRAAPLRTLLGFVPIEANGEPTIGAGLALPLGEAPGSLRAAVKAERGQLAEALNWPSKENGLDIEGIAVKDTHVLLGLRGPAAGGYAIVMHLSVAIGAKGLSLRKGRSYALTFLHLNGLGVRDLFRQGNDVLVLAGPTMDLDAPFALYRWRDVFGRRARRDEALQPGSDRAGVLVRFQYSRSQPGERQASAARAARRDRGGREGHSARRAR